MSHVDNTSPHKHTKHVPVNTKVHFNPFSLDYYQQIRIRHWTYPQIIHEVIVTDGAASSGHMASSAGGTCEQTENFLFDHMTASLQKHA